MSGPGAPSAPEQPVFRAPMRSRDDSVPEGIAVERALERGLCGMGGRVEPPPTTLDDALAAVDARSDERTARRIERFAAVPEGAFVWTRDIDGLFRLGRLVGPWRYDASRDAAVRDLVHVRDCEWLRTAVPPAEVPDPVRATFARGGRNWQRIHADGIEQRSANLWARLLTD